MLMYMATGGRTFLSALAGSLCLLPPLPRVCFVVFFKRFLWEITQSQHTLKELGGWYPLVAAGIRGGLC